MEVGSFKYLGCEKRARNSPGYFICPICRNHSGLAEESMLHQKHHLIWKVQYRAQLTASFSNAQSHTSCLSINSWTVLWQLCTCRRFESFFCIFFQLRLMSCAFPSCCLLINFSVVCLNNVGSILIFMLLCWNVLCFGFTFFFLPLPGQWLIHWFIHLFSLAACSWV